MDSKIILKLTFVHQVAAGARPPLFAIFEGLAMMLSPKVGELVLACRRVGSSLGAARRRRVAARAPAKQGRKNNEEDVLCTCCDSDSYIPLYMFHSS